MIFYKLLECDEYAQLSKIDPYPSQGFVGGTTTNVNEFPHMAAIGSRDNNKTTWTCGGSLISQDFVMTAAHCALRLSRVATIIVRVGDKNLENEDDGANPQEFRVKRIFIHPEYTSQLKYNDIALFQLSSKAL